MTTQTVAVALDGLTVISLGSSTIVAASAGAVTPLNISLNADFYEIDRVDSRGIDLEFFSFSGTNAGPDDQLPIRLQNPYLDTDALPAWNFRWAMPEEMRLELRITTSGTEHGPLIASMPATGWTADDEYPSQFNPLDNIYGVNATLTRDAGLFEHLATLRNGSRPTLSLTITDEPLTEPIDVTALAGSPAARADLSPGRMSVTALAGSPAARASLLPGNLSVRARAGLLTEIPNAYARLKAPALPRATASAGSPTALADLFPGKRFRITAGAGSPAARVALLPGRMGVAALAGSPASRGYLLPGNLSVSARAGRRPRGRADLMQPLNIPPASAMSGMPTARASLQTPKTLPAVAAAAGVPLADAILFPGKMGVSAATGGPTARARMRQLPLPKVTASAGEPVADASILPSIRSSSFRYIPDYFVFRNREIEPIDLPRVQNEVEGGSYRVSGLPDGLSYDSGSHRITGTLTDSRERIELTVSYAEPVDG